MFLPQSRLNDASWTSVYRVTVLQTKVFEWRVTGDFQAEDRGNETQAEQFPGVQDSL